MKIKIRETIMQAFVGTPFVINAPANTDAIPADSGTAGETSLVQRFLTVFLTCLSAWGT
jgi:hypothetical protein